MKKIEMKVEMGARVKDVVSGYEGIVSAYTVHITGCDVVAIKSRGLDKDGKIQDPVWIDVTRVEVIGPPAPEIAAVIKKSDDEEGRTGSKTGGPQDRSKRFSDI
ncbi:MAG: hypothetical protein ABFD77_02605 [Thermotogota bacterium]